MSPHRRPLVLALAGLALLAASAGVAHGLRVAGDRPYDLGFIPSARALRWISLGHPTLVANTMWLRAVQYMGENRADERGWAKLRPAIEVVTDLDPRHGYAYQTSANILASAGLLADSNAILEKGTRNVGDRYIIPFQRGVNAFLYDENFAEAGRWFEIAARTPGAPARLREYVVSMYVKGDTAEAALGFLRRVEEAAEDDESRRAIRFQIDRATLERDATRIERAAFAWVRTFGILPVVPLSLVVEGFLPSIPEDPFGGVYYFDEEGRVRSTAYWKRFERPLTGAAREGELQRGRNAVEQALENNR
jgi:hypothetical protein